MVEIGITIKHGSNGKITKANTKAIRHFFQKSD